MQTRVSLFEVRTLYFQQNFGNKINEKVRLSNVKNENPADYEPWAR